MRPIKVGDTAYLSGDSYGNWTDIGFFCEVIAPPYADPDNVCWFKANRPDVVFIRPKFIEPSKDKEFKKALQEIRDGNLTSYHWDKPEELWKSHEEWWVSTLTHSQKLHYEKYKATAHPNTHLWGPLCNTCGTLIKACACGTGE